MPTCRALKKNGEACKRSCNIGSPFCNSHLHQSQDVAPAVSQDVAPAVSQDVAPAVSQDVLLQLAHRVPLPLDSASEFQVPSEFLDTHDYDMIPPQEAAIDKLMVAARIHEGALSTIEGALTTHEGVLKEVVHSLKNNDVNHAQILHLLSDLTVRLNDLTVQTKDLMIEQALQSQKVDHVAEMHVLMSTSHSGNSAMSGCMPVIMPPPALSNTNVSSVKTTSTSRGLKKSGVKCKAICMSHGGPCPYASAIDKEGLQLHYCIKHRDAKWTPETHQRMVALVQLKNS
jgi:hypothetical protein